MGQERPNECGEPHLVGRRDFLADIGRILALGGLFTTSWMLLWARSKRPVSTQEISGQGKCAVDSPCHACAALDTCGLPRALWTRLLTRR
jgi:hypothetical protein